MKKCDIDVDLWFENYRKLDGNEQYEFVLEVMKNTIEDGIATLLWGISYLYSFLLSVNLI